MQRFTADVSHELRTPLAALRSVGEVALQRRVNRFEYADAIGSMLEEANRLTRLIDSLLMLSRMDAGHVDLNLAECNVFEVLQQCVTLLDVLAQEKRQSLIFQSSGDGTIAADEVLFRYALINIIHNAIKFTPLAGTIEVHASGAPSTGVEITVDDQGPGIPEESREKIFERFYRLSPGQTGAGLGLPIAKWIVEAHHGAISVSASTSGGSRFTIRLPHQRSDVTSQAASEGRRIEVPFSPVSSLPNSQSL